MGDFEQSVSVPVQPESDEEEVAAGSSSDETSSVSSSQQGKTFDTSKYTITEARDEKTKSEGKFVPKEEPKKLEVSGLRMTPTGDLTIRFSKPIKLPSIRISEPENQNSTVADGSASKRDLARLKEIEDAVKLHVKGAD